MKLAIHSNKSRVRSRICSSVEELGCLFFQRGRPDWKAKLRVLFVTLASGLVLQLGCSRTGHSVGESKAIPEPAQSTRQATRPQFPEETHPMIDRSATEKRGAMEIIDLKKSEIKKTYFSFSTWYYGSDKDYHYLPTVADVIYRIRRSEVNDEELRSFYREKIARDRSKVPSIGVPHRSKEFLEWVKATKVERVSGIDRNQDD